MTTRECDSVLHGTADAVEMEYTANDLWNLFLCIELMPLKTVFRLLH